MWRNAACPGRAEHTNIVWDYDFIDEENQLFFLVNLQWLRGGEEGMQCNGRLTDQLSTLKFSMIDCCPAAMACVHWDGWHSDASGKD